MPIHLVTYATPRFRLRQRLLGLSARWNGVVDTVTEWTPKSLLAAGFEERCKDIKLTERGSGFWAWKPFIIHQKLCEVPDGDIVYYCDVGRRYPFKLLEAPIRPYLTWMEDHGQNVLPGIYIPWSGPMSVWTKRAAFKALGLDNPTAHQCTPIQASFSFWKASSSSRELCGDWLSACATRVLISDDPSPPPMEELPDFFEHRHDQSLLSLCCIKAGVQGLDVGTKLSCDTQHPDEILVVMGNTHPAGNAWGKLLRMIARCISSTEYLIRTRIKFGKDRPEPTNPTNPNVP